jgi:hypothetical protein
MHSKWLAIFPHIPINPFHTAALFITASVFLNLQGPKCIIVLLSALMAVATKIYFKRTYRERLVCEVLYLHITMACREREVLFELLLFKAPYLKTSFTCRLLYAIKKGPDCS